MLGIAGIFGIAGMFGMFGIAGMFGIVGIAGIRGCAAGCFGGADTPVMPPNIANGSACCVSGSGC